MSHGENAPEPEAESESEAEPDEITLIWWGEIDLDNAGRIRVELNRAIDSGVGTVFIDLTGVTFIDSSGLGVLINGWKRARADNLALYVSRPSGQVARTLRAMGLLDALLEPPFGA